MFFVSVTLIDSNGFRRAGKVYLKLKWWIDDFFPQDFCLISTRDHCQRFQTSIITRQAVFVSAQILSSGFLEWNFSVVTTYAPQLFQILGLDTSFDFIFKVFVALSQRPNKFSFREKISLPRKWFTRYSWHQEKHNKSEYLFQICFDNILCQDMLNSGLIVTSLR